ncbi:MAG TPA: hypothetical protein DIU39_09390 [Flavobacteriales bacterium]|nr:hypothetical protein [Flavobacteriales bacterium]|tara:strand:- start:84058 stop:84567 length:510 start_codon:yes stop_codon:yes gene_type:complete
MRFYTKISTLVLLMALAFSCKVSYKFNQASISPDTKTVSVDLFQNYASLAGPGLNQQFTEALKDVFLTQTNLTIVPQNGDIQFSGAITGYTIKPVAIQGNETAALNRLTITVNVKYVNTKNEKENFETSFSRFADYDSNLNFSEVEEQVTKEVIDQLTQDIFNKAFSNW